MTAFSFNLQAVLNNPAWLRSAIEALVPLKNPDDNVIRQALLGKFATTNAVQVAGALATGIKELVDVQTLVNGDRGEPGTDPDTWDGELEDRFEEFLSGLTAYIGQGGIGKLMMTTSFTEPGFIPAKAAEVAEALFAALMRPPHDATVLAAVDVAMVKSELAQFADNPGVTADARAYVLGELGALEGMFGDRIQLQQILEMVADSDDIIAASGLSHLGLDEGFKNNLRQFSKSGPEWIKEAIAVTMGEQYVAPPVAEKPKRRKKVVEPAATTPPAETQADIDAAQARELAELLGDTVVEHVNAPHPAPAGPVHVTVHNPNGEVLADAVAPGNPYAHGTLPPLDPVKALLFIANHTAINERDLSTALGCSRGTLKNMRDGKAKISDEQAETIRRHVVEHSNALSLLLDHS